MTTKTKCDECKKDKTSKGVVRFKNRFLCFSCRQKEKGAMIMKNIPIQETLSEALEKEYEVKGTTRKNGTLPCFIYVPKILFGKKVKLVLVENK